MTQAAAEEAATPAQAGLRYEALTEGIVEEILTKEKSHPLGVKVRCHTRTHTHPEKLSEISL